MYDEIVNKYYSEIYNYCHTKLGYRHTAAEGVTQAAFFALYKKLNRLKLSDNIKIWLYRAADFEIKKYIRKNLSFLPIEECSEEISSDPENYPSLSDRNSNQRDVLVIGKQKLYSKISEYDRSKNKIYVWLFPVLFAVAVMLTANYISVMAWDMNIISAVIEFTQGGFSVNFGKNEHKVIELPTSEDDPYGIIAECAKYDIYPETPHYLPEGFELVFAEHNESSYCNLATFDFYNGKKSISLSYTLYWDKVGQIGIPSDEYNISETTVNGYPAIISKEDDQFTLAYQIDNTVIVIFSQDVDYAECDKIVASIK